jgi:hypothetical protein
MTYKVQEPIGHFKEGNAHTCGIAFSTNAMCFFSYDIQWVPTKYVLRKIHYFRKVLVLRTLFIIFHSYYVPKFSEIKNQSVKVKIKNLINYLAVCC